ncbi:enoyl-CoA hydratase/isomerase family protein [Salsipaludibacter albus]|uniref:enoyl-CoA hydratase/isomerase family protein n=1 Tax=Salsipaludibacter albus TaxID=2849650 RepID=UPI001EE3DEE2|nr:enoyl-CoA hydratase-related protein [Salsipaludibacter albus]MBY5163647.1 enoyl-CoA hydratase/isomerase family protein [Salsipaludibacter albus]
MAVTASTADRVGRIVLDRPPANSYDPDFLEELDAAITSVVDDDAIAVVVSSSGEKFFSAGADVKGFLDRSADDNNAMVARAHEVFDRFAAEDPVFVAAIAGHALGGGYEIALACDIRVAATGRYRIGLPEVTLGLLPGTGGTQRLPRLIGRGRALDLMLAGRAVTPEEAHELGMVDRLVEADELEATVDEMVTSLAGGAPLAIAAVKHAVHRGVDRDLADGLRVELEELAPLFASDDAVEGMTAFTEKRSPEYRGS